MEISKILLWSGFSIFVLGMLLLDLLVFHRKSHEVKLKEALLWSAVWISLALVFNVGIYIWQGKQPALEFLTGYLIEKSLSVDNIFVFLMLFSYFKVPPRYQHQVLFWGILGALLMRAGFIAGGITLIKHFHWIIYVFGGFLVFVGAKMLMAGILKVPIGLSLAVVAALLFLSVGASILWPPKKVACITAGE